MGVMLGRPRYLPGMACAFRQHRNHHLVMQRLAQLSFPEGILSHTPYDRSHRRDARFSAARLLMNLRFPFETIVFDVFAFLEKRALMLGK